MTALGREMLERYQAMEKTAVDSVGDRMAEFSRLLADQPPPDKAGRS